MEERSPDPYDSNEEQALLLPVRESGLALRASLESSPPAKYRYKESRRGTGIDALPYEVSSLSLLPVT